MKSILKSLAFIIDIGPVCCHTSLLVHTRGFVGELRAAFQGIAIHFTQRVLPLNPKLLQLIFHLLVLHRFLPIGLLHKPDLPSQRNQLFFYMLLARLLLSVRFLQLLVLGHQVCDLQLQLGCFFLEGLTGLAGGQQIIPGSVIKSQQLLILSGYALFLGDFLVVGVG